MEGTGAGMAVVEVGYIAQEDSVMYLRSEEWMFVSRFKSHAYAICTEMVVCPIKAFAHVDRRSAMRHSAPAK
jgi:hypothetical protein